MSGDDISAEVKGTPIAFFKGKLTERTGIAPEPGAEDDGHVSCESSKTDEERLAKARMLQELEAYVAWREYVTGIIWGVLAELLDDNESEILQTFCGAEECWESWPHDKKIAFINNFFVLLARSFDTEVPRFYMKEEWTALCSKLYPSENDVIYPEFAYAVYKREKRSIVFLMKAGLKSPFWWVLYALTHEFAHHIIFVQSEKLFGDLDGYLDRRKFETVYYEKAGVLLNCPLRTVISCCEQNKFSTEKIGEYLDYHYNGADNEDYDYFLEEHLAEHLACTVTETIRELVRLFGTAEPSALVYANILLKEIKSASANLEELSRSMGMKLDGEPLLKTIDIKKFGTLDEYFLHQDDMDRSAALIGDRIHLMKPEKDGEFGPRIVAAYHQDLFISFLQGRFSAYYEQSQNAL